MRRLILLTGILAMFGVTSPAANACTCAGTGTPCDSYGSATAVFVGTATAVRESERVKPDPNEIDWAPVTFKFSVEQSYLGVEGTEIEISTGRGGGDCGYSFK